MNKKDEPCKEITDKTISGRPTICRKAGCNYCKITTREEITKQEEAIALLIRKGSI